MDRRVSDSTPYLQFIKAQLTPLALDVQPREPTNTVIEENFFGQLAEHGFSDSHPRLEGSSFQPSFVDHRLPSGIVDISSAQMGPRESIKTQIKDLDDIFTLINTGASERGDLAQKFPLIKPDSRKGDSKQLPLAEKSLSSRVLDNERRPSDVKGTVTEPPPLSSRNVAEAASESRQNKTESLQMIVQKSLLADEESETPSESGRSDFPPIIDAEEEKSGPIASVSETDQVSDHGVSEGSSQAHQIFEKSPEVIIASEVEVAKREPDLFDVPSARAFSKEASVDISEASIVPPFSSSSEKIQIHDSSPEDRNKTSLGHTEHSDANSKDENVANPSSDDKARSMLSVAEASETREQELQTQQAVKDAGFATGSRPQQAFEISYNKCNDLSCDRRRMIDQYVAELGYVIVISIFRCIRGTLRCLVDG